MEKLSEAKRKEIVRLRLLGKSIPEIVILTGHGKTTIQRYVQTVKVPQEYTVRLREKQGGAKERATALRENVREEACKLIGTPSKRDALFLLIGLYWGEGTKRDFSIINSDPYLIATFIRCLEVLSIERDSLSVSLRVHSDIAVPPAKTFWSKVTGTKQERIERVEVIDGKKKGKLRYGMCRVRIRSGIRSRLIIQSAIEMIGKESLTM